MVDLSNSYGISLSEVFMILFSVLYLGKPLKGQSESQGLFIWPRVRTVGVEIFRTLLAFMVSGEDAAGSESVEIGELKGPDFLEICASETPKQPLQKVYDKI